MLFIAQLNPQPGGIAANVEAITHAVREAQHAGAHALILPEQAILGYPLRDMLVRFPKLVTDNESALLELAKQAPQLPIILGFAEHRYHETASWAAKAGKPYYNAGAVLYGGMVQAVARKQLLPTYHEFEDYRVFEPAVEMGLQRPPRWQAQAGEAAEFLPLENGVLTLPCGLRVALTVCEDLWACEPGEQSLYAEHGLNRLFEAKPDLLVNVSASPSRCGKEARRNALLESVTRRFNTPILYVNQVGGVDELIFDGASRLVNAQGETVARAPMFEPFTGTFTLENPEENPISPWPNNVEAPWYTTPEDAFNPYDTRDLPRTYEAILLGIRDYFKKCGFQRAVLGLSGGLDSAVNVVLLADALGPENVFGFSFPSRLTPGNNRSDAETLAHKLGIGWAEMPITAMQDAFLEQLNSQRPALARRWGTPSPWSFAEDNVQAMSRATLLRLIGNDYNALPIATSDKSEFYMGYTTVNGDMSGALAPLGDVCKTKVRALARWLNENRPQKNAIPEDVVKRPSGADLALNPETGQLLTAEEALMPYEVIDEIIWRIEAHQADAETLTRIPWAWEAENGRLSASQKAQWVAKFFKRLKASAFKWHIAPPTLLIDAHGTLVKSAYHHVICATQTNY